MQLQRCCCSHRFAGYFLVGGGVEGGAGGDYRSYQTQGEVKVREGGGREEGGI